MTTTQHCPAFRKPWTSGASGYHEADTFAAAKEGFRRVRTSKIFHMPAGTEADEQLCVVCSCRLGGPAEGKGTKLDNNSTWTYSPQHKSVGNGMHYVCSWSNLFSRIFQLHDEGKI